MKTEEFKKWLEEERKLRPHVIQSRISNCRKVEIYYMNLDLQYSKDGGNSLKETLTYTSKDERDNVIPIHKIPINGNIREGSAAFKQAVNLYMKFCISQNNQL